MRIDLQIRAHLSEKVAANFLLAILEGGEFITEIQASVATLSLVGHKLAGDLSGPGQLPNAPLELRAPHDNSLGQLCPSVKRRWSVLRGSEETGGLVRPPIPAFPVQVVAVPVFFRFF